MRTAFALAVRSVPAPERTPLRQLWSRLWLRQKTRRALLRMTDEQLKDVGLTRWEADQEARLPCWRLLR